MAVASKQPENLLPQVGDWIRTCRNEYEILKLLGKGAYGTVFEVKRKDDHLAMKIEPENTKRSVLSMDCRVLRGAHEIKSPHFCPLIDRGKVVLRFRYVVMKLLGRNLWDLRTERSDNRYTLSTSLKIAEQCLFAIEDLHQIGYLHRDVKPNNFAIGRPETGQQQIIHMFDFGLARKYIDSENTKPRSNPPFRGTPRYASLAALKRKELSRKDDLESWFYMIVEWTTGLLPWTQLKKSQFAEIAELKENSRFGNGLSDLLVGCPEKEFHAILQHIDSMDYHSVPNYDVFYELIQQAAQSNNVDPGEPLDWDRSNRYCGPTKLERHRKVLVNSVENELLERKAVEIAQ
ncbi:Tau-tubulin kinase 2 [Aphelenchoides besseyi]|nr:Tau-tubulin kinase 2 [Aphelenchoides besseyi]